MGQFPPTGNGPLAKSYRSPALPNRQPSPQLPLVMGARLLAPGLQTVPGRLLESGWWCPQPIAKRLHDVARQCHIGHGLQCAAPQVCAGILTCTQQANGKRNVVFSGYWWLSCHPLSLLLVLGGWGSGNPVA
mmetsp:Transcript_3752/g.7181  ORF Transcript_3752/g.7181 Transcript_3752/m.7181 type:complete len:132 (+) Transcript_3752:104-499(+)